MEAHDWRQIHSLTYPSEGFIVSCGDERRDVTIEEIDPTLPPGAPQRHSWARRPA
jgi:hypothetical protein